MEEITAVINEYVKSELLVVVPVLYILAKFLDSSKVNNQKIPLILMIISLVLAGIYTFATVDISTPQLFLLALFSTLVQGILLSGAAVFSGILIQTVNAAKNKQA